jgi:phage shock protein A
MEYKMKKEINEKLERFIDHADTKFDLAGEMFDKLQKQIKELDKRIIKVNDRTSLLTNDSGDCILDINNKISALNAKNQKRADAIKILDDKIENISDSITNTDILLGEGMKKLNNKIKELEQKANRTGQFHLDAVNEKFAELEKKINDNNGYKKLWEENTKDYNDLARERLEDYTRGVKNSEQIEILHDAVHKIFARMDSTDNNIKHNYKKLEGNIGAVTTAHNMGVELAKEDSALVKDDYDILEGKYHQLRSELDCVYKVLEMDALDIQDLYEQLENHPKKGVKNAK